MAIGGQQPGIRREHLRVRAREFAAALAFVVAALLLTYPWISSPARSMIGLPDKIHHELSADSMLPMTFAGWIDFSIFRLGKWPLSRTDYLMYPRGASQGDSFDGLLPAIVTAALAIVLPLPMAHSVAVLLGFILAGWAMWKLGSRLWGPGACAFAIALASMMFSYLSQRFLTHANLTYIWTIPVSMLAFDRWRERPDRRATIHWALTFPFMAMASWYVLIAGLIFQGCASAAVLFHRLYRDPAVTPNHLKSLPVVWAIGLALTVVIAWPMLDDFGRRRPIPESEIAGFSAPLMQYVMPFNRSHAGRLQFFTDRQSAMKTPWEAQFSIPLLLTLLALGWMLARGSSVLKTALILTIVLGVMTTLGPYLQITQMAASPNEVPRLPMHYLLRMWSGFGFVRIPGRAVTVVFFAIAVAAGFALNAIGCRLSARRELKILWWPILAGLVVFCAWWSLPAYKMQLAPWPEVPRFYQDLGREPGRGAVFDVPFSTYLFPHYNYYQLWHGRREVSSVLYHDAISLKSLKYLLKNPELAIFMDLPIPIKPQVLDRAATTAFLDRRAAEGIEYVVIHPAFVDYLILSKKIDPNAKAAYDRIASAWKPRLVYQDARILVYRTPLPEKPKHKKKR